MPGADPCLRTASLSRTFATCHVSAAEIIMFDDYLVVYKQLGDLMFYVTGSLAENELILHAVLLAFYEATSTLLRYAGAAAAADT